MKKIFVFIALATLGLFVFMPVAQAGMLEFFFPSLRVDEPDL